MSASGELARLLSSLEGVAEKLVRDHTPDAGGYCRACSTSDAGPMRWPCRLRGIGEDALAARERGE